MRGEERKEGEESMKGRKKGRWEENKKGRETERQKNKKGRKEELEQRDPLNRTLSISDTLFYKRCYAAFLSAETFVKGQKKWGVLNFNFSILVHV